MSEEFVAVERSAVGYDNQPQEASNKPAQPELEEILKRANELGASDVFIVVGDTFEEEVIKNNKDIVVLFYSPWCYHCKALLPKYEEVAKILKPKNKNLILTKINAIDNEVESIDNYDFPQIKLYPGNKKDNPPIDYNGDKSIDDIIKFIKNNVAYPISIDNENDKNAEL